MHRPSRDAWGFAYYMMRRGDGPHRHPPAAGDTAGALVACGVLLIVFLALHAFVTVVPPAMIVKVAFWSAVSLFFVIGALHDVVPRWLANALLVVFVTATVSVPMGVIVWFGSLAP